MTDTPNKDIEQDHNRDEISLLIASAGPRDSVTPESMDKAHRRVAAHWESVVSDRRNAARRRLQGFYLKAAGVAMIALLPLLYFQVKDFSPEISPANIDRIVGEVRIGGVIASVGQQVQVDTIVETGVDGRIALAMANGQSLRLDHGSRIIVHAPGRVSLQAGAVYINTGGEDLPPILVSTPMGTAQDVGTQFQLRLANSVLLVAVRDGIVKIDQVDGESLAINRGRYIELGATGETLSQPLPDDDNSFDWVETVAPVFDLEGATLEEYLLWYARESGYRLQWTEPESEKKAQRLRLNASIAGRTLAEGLQIVSQIAPGFEHRIEDGIVWATVQ